MDVNRVTTPGPSLSELARRAQRACQRVRNSGGPRNIVVITALWQRPAIAELMLARLQKQGVRVVAVGSEGEDSRRLAEDNGAHYVEHENQPLGAKWNAALKEAEQFNPDGVVVLGSDNLVSESFFSFVERNLSAKVDYFGLLDGWMYQPADERFWYWPGYVGGRCNEPIGSSRCYSGELLDRIGWHHLWDDRLHRNLDGSATRHLADLSIHPRVYNGVSEGVFHLGIKTAINLSRLPRNVQPRDLKLLGELFGDDLVLALRSLC